MMRQVMNKHISQVDIERLIELDTLYSSKPSHCLGFRQI
jgi:hypothetical protein